MDRSITVGSNTPWGAADSVEIFHNGIVFVSTPSHGGYYVPKHLNNEIPARWRAASFNRQGERGWYEEDCDWCMVAINFPDIFPTDARQPARDTFDRFIAPKLVDEQAPEGWRSVETSV